MRAADRAAPVSKRLEIFHETWKGKELVMRYVPGMKVEDLAPAAAESALVHAIEAMAKRRKGGE